MKLNGTVTIDIAGYDEIKDALKEGVKAISDRDRFAAMVIDYKCSWWFTWDEEAKEIVVVSYYEDDLKEMKFPKHIVEEYKAHRKQLYIDSERAKAEQAIITMDPMGNCIPLKGETNE